METAYIILQNHLTLPYRLLLIAVFIIGFAVCMMIAKRRWTQSILISLLISYILFILLITLIARTPAAEPKAEWVPLWSWYEAIVNANKGLLEEIILNVILFVPAGVLLTLIDPFRLSVSFRPVHAFIIGFICSAIIETTQFITCRGLFEWDDMLHNGLGCLLGYGIGRIVEKACSLRQQQ